MNGECALTKETNLQKRLVKKKSNFVQVKEGENKSRMRLFCALPTAQPNFFSPDHPRLQA
ncbi:hypothetical protein DL89DRAFT_117529 [Linderina pennispora]|uniref:Uncharacterized protein n=1 Tax=Linderina pennispora TaxID=61395 RepID=A0A1Y1VVK5_9FUNG|nr:uncharacterized protein DL89DRAFT_117529 [Linderina pennispora]ORX65332.1 hypothetical protein DL89DRAFT_117529 [Linderina pennispora]